jgi:putative endonuclease
MYYFYIIQSLKNINQIYSGSTNNLKIRMSQHNQGKVISTKPYLPWRLVYYEAFLSEKDARIREQKFKKHGKGNIELKKRIKHSLSIKNNECKNKKR